MEIFTKNLLFKGLSLSDINHFREIIESRKFNEGQVIIKDGDIGDCVYLIGSGSVRVTKTVSQAKNVLLTIKKTNDFFGEMALIEHAPRSAAITAHEDCELGIISKVDFENLMEVNSMIGLNILRTISAQLRNSNDHLMHEFQEKEHIYKQQVSRLRSLFEFSKVLNANHQWKDLFEFTPKLIKKHVRCDAISLYIFDGTTCELISVTGASSTPTRQLVKAEFVDKVSSNNRPIEIKAKDIRAIFLQPVKDAATFARIVCQPIMSDKHFKGVLYVMNKEDEGWGSDDLAYISTAASYISFALDNIELTKKIVESEKLTAVGKNSGAIMHDIKNLVAVVHNYAQLILRAEDQADLEDIVKNIIQTTKLMINMSKEVLLFVQGDIKLSKIDVKVEEIVLTVQHMVQRELDDRHIKFTMDLVYNPTTKMDFDKVIRALYNIVLNAAQSAGKKSPVIKISCNKKEKGFEITVEDNGIGISPDMIEKIFDPFITSKSGGTGLGLPIVKAIVEAHQGSINVQSEVDKGTTVSIYFPL